MASLLESLTQSLQPDILGQIGKAVGLDGAKTQSGLDVVGPLLTGALGSTASSPQGLESLMGLVSQTTGASGASDLLKLATGAGSSTMLSGLFGSGLGAVSGTLDKALGFKVSPLIGLAAPFLLSQIAQRMKSGAVDKGGLANLLHGEQKDFMARGGPAATIVQQALDAGKAAVATRARYSSEQWNKVRLGPIAAAGLVIGATPSGVSGTTKEVIALAEAVKAAKKDAAPTSLISLAAEQEITGDDLKTLPTNEAALLGLVRDSVTSVATHNPAEAATYAKVLVEVATKVAEASKEGGFLGIGGTRVSAEEQSAIDRIKSAVGVSVT